MSIHINAKKGDIADTILLPGDPLRAKYIAETFLEDVITIQRSSEYVWLHGNIQRKTHFSSRDRYGCSIHFYLCNRIDARI